MKTTRGEAIAHKKIFRGNVDHRDGEDAHVHFGTWGNAVVRGPPAQSNPVPHVCPAADFPAIEERVQSVCCDRDGGRHKTRTRPIAAGAIRRRSLSPARPSLVQFVPGNGPIAVRIGAEHSLAGALRDFVLRQSPIAIRVPSLEDVIDTRQFVTPRPLQGTTRVRLPEGLAEECRRKKADHPRHSPTHTFTKHRLGPSPLDSQVLIRLDGERNQRDHILRFVPSGHHLYGQFTCLRSSLRVSPEHVAQFRRP